MAAYFLADIEVEDPEVYSEFIQKASEIIARYSGEFVVHSADITPVTGEWHPKRILLIRFESPQKVIDCFRSPEYQQIVALRERSTNSRAVIIEE